MAATVELFEFAHTRIQLRASRDILQRAREVVARRKYSSEIKERRIRQDNFEELLMEVAARRAVTSGCVVVLTPSQNVKEILGASVSSPQSWTTESSETTSVDLGESISSGKVMPTEAMPTAVDTDESDEVSGPSVVGADAVTSVDGCDIWDSKDNSLKTMSANARKKRSARDRKAMVKDGEDLTSNPFQQFNEGLELAASNRSGSNASTLKVNKRKTSSLTTTLASPKGLDHSDKGGKSIEHDYPMSRRSSKVMSARGQPSNIRAPLDEVEQQLSSKLAHSTTMSFLALIVMKMTTTTLAGRL